MEEVRDIPGNVKSEGIEGRPWSYLSYFLSQYVMMLKGKIVKIVKKTKLCKTNTRGLCL